MDKQAVDGDAARETVVGASHHQSRASGFALLARIHDFQVAECEVFGVENAYGIVRLVVAYNLRAIPLAVGSHLYRFSALAMAADFQHPMEGSSPPEKQAVVGSVQ